LGLSKPSQPLPWIALAAASPSLYTRFLRQLEVLAIQDPTLKSAAGCGNMLKAFGCPLFVVGHMILTQQQPSYTNADWGYLSACVALGLAFAGTYRGKPFPEMVPVSGLGLIVFGMLGRKACQDAGVPATLANVALAAGATLVYLGAQALLLRAGVMKQPLPGLSLAQLGQVASCLFGFANFVKFFQFAQAGNTPFYKLFGQFLKITASTCLASGNALILDWHKVEVPAAPAWNMAGLVAAVALTMPQTKA